VLKDTFQGSQVVYSLTLISCCFGFWLHRLGISCAVIFPRRARSARFLSLIFLLRSVLGSALNFWFPREHSGPRPGLDSTTAYAPPWTQSARQGLGFALITASAGPGCARSCPCRQGASFSVVSSQLLVVSVSIFSAASFCFPLGRSAVKDSCCRQDFRSPLQFPVRCAERAEIPFGSVESSPSPNLRFPAFCVKL
jgi:hypothetical protein